ncbi:MAG: hypothetical protein KA841_02785 [Chitinophagales bacterium]|jgi:cytochrome c peroxidase|nr:hypothetical protein [Chitinophagales bacterium]
MNKRIGLLLLSFTVLSLLLQQCKPDPHICEVDCDEADSLYTGTPDTITRPFKFPPVVIPPDITLTKEGVQLGRMLFYDPVLSSDSTMSCGTCHIQQFAFADGGKAKSENVFGQLTKRNTPPLFNLIWFKDFFWDGRTNSLPLQVQDALIHEQNFNAAQAIPKLAAKPEYVRLFKKAFGRPGDITEVKIEKAIAQFMMTMVSAESKFDKVMRGQLSFSPEEERGFYNLFFKDTGEANGYGADCFHCHAASNGASNISLIDNNFHNNGLDFAASFTDFADNGRGDVTGNFLDNGKFRTPHIRNIEVTGPYMRDGRFTTLEQVVNFYNDSLKISPTNDPQLKFAHQGGIRYLTTQDKADLVAFMKTLTDTAFLHNPKFSNPW